MLKNNSIHTLFIFLIFTSLLFISCNPYQLDTSKYAKGIDITYVNNLQQIHYSDVSYVVSNVTVGDSLNGNFSKQWKHLKSNHLIRGAYHIYDCKIPPIKQVAPIVKAVGKLNPQELPIIVNIHAKKHQIINPKNYQKDLLIFLTQLRIKTGKIPIISTDKDLADKLLTTSLFSKFPLCIHSETDDDIWKLPSKWKKTGWRFVKGYPSIDKKENKINFFNGSKNDLIEFIKETTIIN